MATEHGAATRQSFDVPDAEPLPALEGLPGVGRLDGPVESSPEVLYFDTPDFALGSHGITLLYSSGGDDGGWQLALPADGSNRPALHGPVGSGKRPPPELTRWITRYLRGRVPVPVARLTIRRSLYRLLGPDGALLAEVSDDDVRAEPLVPPSPARSRHDWTVVLVDGTHPVARVLPRLLTAAGARPAETPAWDRALGHTDPPPDPLPPPAAPGTTTAGILREYAGRQVCRIFDQDPPLRSGDPDAAHRMRVATRRLRSQLATHRDVLAPAATAALRGELSWFARLVGAVRDAEVAHAHVREVLTAQPAALALEPVQARVDGTLAAILRTARARLLRAMNSTRYFRLLENLDRFAADPPLTAASGRAPQS
ncbi:MAG: CHAD domain-containing protein, partial [Actinomycetales bacterium]